MLRHARLNKTKKNSQAWPGQANGAALVSVFSTNFRGRDFIFCLKITSHFKRKMKFVDYKHTPVSLSLHLQRLFSEAKLRKALSKGKTAVPSLTPGDVEKTFGEMPAACILVVLMSAGGIDGMVC
jgi:hypothetical protein